MRRPLKRSLKQLITDNRQQLLNDRVALKKLEIRLEERHLSKVE